LLFPNPTRHLLFTFIPVLLLTGPASLGGPQTQKPKAPEPKRLTFSEARRLLEGEAEGNLINRPQSFTRTRLRSGQVIELHYPVAVSKREARTLKAMAAGYGLLYESEADYREATRPRHILEDLIPDGQAFVSAVPQLVARLQKRLRTGGQGLDYSRASLRRIDLYLASYQRTHTTADADPQLFQELTAYYGEALKRTLKGEWRVRQERVDRTHTQSEPNITFEAGAGELKPWSSVFSALYDEDRRGMKLTAAFSSDLEAARLAGR